MQCRFSTVMKNSKLIFALAVFALFAVAMVAWLRPAAPAHARSFSEPPRPAPDSISASVPGTRPASQIATAVAPARRAPAAALPRTNVMPPPPPSAMRLTLEDGGRNRAFSVAMDELVVRSSEGIERRVSVPTQSDMQGLRAQWDATRQQQGGVVFLVAYEDGVARTEKNRRLVTPDIRVELSDGQTLAQAIPGAVAVTQPDYAPGFVVAQMPDSFAAVDALAAVRALGGVARADVLLARQQSRRVPLPNDPLIAQQWHLKNTGQDGGVAGADINVAPIWNYPGGGIRGQGVLVAIVDDGLQTDHPDLAANVRTDIDYDWNDSTPDDPSPGNKDDHGTSCAGNVAAIANNGIGVSGSAPEANIVGLRLIAASEGDREEAEAMSWRNDVIHIKSNSWGPDDDGGTLEGPGSLTKAAFRTATTTGRGGSGTIFVWAGGNGRADFDDSNYDGYANSIYTIAVGAITNVRSQAWYSEPGANLLVAAPSSGDTGARELDITTTDRTGAAGYNTRSGVSGDYATDFGGTSSAAPTAAGVIALMLERNPKLGWRDVQEVLVKSARQINPGDLDWTTNAAGYHFSHKFGAGLIDATAAVRAAASWTNLAAQTSVSSSQSSLSVPIPDDNAAGITRTFNLGGSRLRVEHVTVRVNITHPYRGDLAITLTSPTGVQSRLAELHDDTGRHYADWTFMTTHNWGERSTGAWTLRIADRYSGGAGTLNGAEITIYGTALPAGNPPPVVRVSAPSSKTSVAANTAVKLAATVFDRTASGSEGTIARVDFYANGLLVGSDDSAPYSLQWKPPGGVQAIAALAVDSEGAVGRSATVNIRIAGSSASGPRLEVTRQTSAAGGKVLVVRGKASGSGVLRINSRNRHALKPVRVRSGATFSLRVRLHTGVNIIVLKATDSSGHASNTVRIRRTRR